MRLRRQIVAGVVLAILVGAGCAGTNPGRLDAGTVRTDEPGGKISIGAGQPVIPQTTQPPTTRVQTVERSPQQEDICTGDAGNFIPALDGYSVAGSGDVTAGLPEGQEHVESVAGAQAIGPDETSAVIAVVVLDPEVVDSPLVQSTIDFIAFGVTGAEELQEQALAGFLVLAGTSSKGTSYIWQQCRNVVVSVVSEDADMAKDISLQILS